MTAETPSRFRPYTLAALILFAALISTWFAYFPGLGGSLHFDDHHNLGGLVEVDDAESALRFVATGTAGPLGRPLALASFASQAYAWPQAPDTFIRTNILIHLLNGTLVTWFLYLLGRNRKQPEKQAALIAVGGAAIWMLMPLLASSSLLIIQRMTTLSATFVLLGGIGYLFARHAIDRRPIAALCGMSLSLGVGTALGVLAKENAALLFLFILSVEATLLTRPSLIPRRLWQTWFTCVFIVPLIGLLLFLVFSLPYPESVVLRRDFNGIERLITQAEILWRYLYLAIMPNVPSLGPFHDDYPIRRSPLSLASLLAIAGWLVLICAAFLLRRKVPLFAFAIAWYLAGHLLESTTLSLELYFEHRNYLPIIGPVYALVASVIHVEKQWRRVAIGGLAVYALMLGGVLFSMTSLWGSPALSAEMWRIYKPESQRAHQYLAGFLEQQGQMLAARQLLNRYIDANPGTHGLQLQTVLISCQVEPLSDHGAKLKYLQKELATTKFDFSAVDALQKLHSLVKDDHCRSVDLSAIYDIGQSLLDNPSFRQPVIRHNIHLLMAEIAIEQRNFGLTMDHLHKALDAAFNIETLNFAIEILNNGKRYDISNEFLADARTRTPPLHPVRAIYWTRELDRIENELRALERLSNTDY